MNQIAIGKFIAARRRARGLTQAQLAEQLNTTNKSVSKWENGCCLPDASLYEPLCQALGITIGELFAARQDAGEAQRPADALLVRLLTRSLYHLSDQRVSLSEFGDALSSMAEAALFLRRFSTREEAVRCLARETGLPAEECAAAYDYYIKL